MALTSFIAYQPVCDHPGCSWVCDTGDGGIRWFLNAAEARDEWHDQDGWTDGVVWFCEEHRYEPHSYIDDQGECERCHSPASEHEGKAIA